MSRKSEKIAALIAGCQGASFDAHYLCFFACFNEQLFFEAHDVLEELWLKQGKSGANYSFYKGLIQLAGAFVHLQKNRLKPAVALFDLASANLLRYPVSYEGLQLPELIAMISGWRARITTSDFSTNPLPGSPPPRLAPPAQT